MKKLPAAVSVLLLTFVTTKALPCDLESALRSGDSVFHPVTNDLIASRIQLKGAMQQLENFLARSGSVRAGEWLTYLKWNQLTSEVNAGDSGSTAVLERVNAQFYGRAAGLELPAFIDLRDKLRAYTAILKLKQSPDPQVVFRSKLAFALGIIKRDRPENLTLEELDTLGEIKGWLGDVKQAPFIVDCFNRTFASGNITVGVGKGVVDRILNEDLTQITPVSEYSFGAYVRGQATTNAHASMFFVPNQQTGDVRALLQGQTTTVTTGQQRRVTVGSTIYTSFTTTQKLHFDGKKISTYPAQSQARSSGRINYVRADRLIGWRIAERIAWRRALQLLPQAEAKASRTVSQKSSQDLASRLNEVLRKANAFLAEFALDPLARMGFQTLGTGAQTSNDYLLASLTLATASQLGAPKPGVFSFLGVGAPRPDLQVSLHETTMARLLSQFLGGRYTKDSELENIVAILFGSSDQLSTRPGRDPWEFIFEKNRPIVLRFRNGKLTAELNMTSFTRHSVQPDEPGDETLTGLTTISARYVPRITSEGVVLMRDTAVSTRFARSPSPRLRAFIEAKGAAIFGEKMSFLNLPLPDNQLISPREKLRPTLLDAREGWLHVGGKL